MRKTLFFGILVLGVSLSEGLQAEQIDFTVPEPQAAGCVLGVELVPPAGEQFTPEQEQEMLRGVAERVRLLLPGDAEPRLVRKGEQVFLHLYGELAPESAEKTAARLQHSLNRRVQTCLLAVHPQQEKLFQRAEIVSLITGYELDINVWLESTRHTPPPRLPHLPDTGDTAGYMLAEQAGVDDRGIIGYIYYIVRAPETARSEGLLLTNEDVEAVSISAPNLTQKQDSVRIRFKPEAAPRLHRLTLSAARCKGKMALVSDGSVLAAPSIPAPLSREFILTAANGRDMAYALLPPLLGEVRLRAIPAQDSR